MVIAKELKISVYVKGSLVFHRTFSQFPVVLGSDPSCAIPLVDCPDLPPRYLSFERSSKGELSLVDLIKQSREADPKSPKTPSKRPARVPVHRALKLKIPGEIVIKLKPEEILEDETEIIHDNLTPTHLKSVRDFPVAPDPEPKPEPNPILKPKPRQKQSVKPAGAGLETASPELEWIHEYSQVHPEAKRKPPQALSLEVSVFWQGRLFGIQSFRPGERIILGGEGRGLWIPLIKNDFCFGRQGFGQAHCLIPAQLDGFLFVEDEKVPLSQVPALLREPVKDGNFQIRLDPQSHLQIRLGAGLLAHFRQIPSPPAISLDDRPLPEQLLRKSLTGSAILHFLVLLIILMAAPRQEVPKIKNVPDRVAKLLVVPPPEPHPPPPPPPPKVEPPKPLPVAKPKPEPKPRPQPVVQPRPKPIPRPKQVVVSPNPKLQEVNQIQRRVQERTPTPPPPQPRVEDLGALAALKSLNMAPSQPTEVAAININRDAGGAAASPSTSDILKSVQSPVGQRSPGGGVSVGTQGRGVGSGQGYGVSGLQGKAGQRGIEGAQVGTFQIAPPPTQEGLDREAIMQEVQKHLGRIQQCYERALLQNNSLEGQVEYEWHINPNGRVDSARVLRSSVSGGDALNNCVMGVFRSISFPRSKNGQPSYPKMNIPFRKV